MMFKNPVWLISHLIMMFKNPEWFIFYMIMMFKNPVWLISFILFNELLRFLGEIETDNLTVSNSEIITFDFTVSKNMIFVK